jgi:branched-chain amino acid transport system substrate-binding protein
VAATNILEDVRMPVSRRTLIAATAALSTAPLVRPRAQAANTLRIGVLTDLSGTYSDTSGATSVACARQAVQDFAGSRGLQVEVIEADHQNKPDVGAGIARQWFDQGVDMVTDVPNSAVALAVKTIAVEKNKAYLNTGAASTALTGAGCTPTTIHWGYNTTMLARSAAATVQAGGRSWYFIVADYVFGRDLTQQATGFINAAGGKVLGSAAYPFPTTTDFSAFLLEAQASGADVIAFGNAGGDTVNCIKQAHEFGLTQGGKRLAAMLAFIQVIKSVGLETAQGLLLTESFYWDLNSRSRAFMERIRPKLGGNYVSSEQAGTYAATLHYLKAAADLGVAAAKANGAEVVARMKAMPTDDDCYGTLRIRADGQALHPAYLFQVKAPGESTGPWDLYKLVSTTSGEDAAPPIESCKLTG